MQGKHEYQPELFSQIDYEHLIPKGHLLRRIDRVLDLSFLPTLTKSLYADKMGRPSIDPIVFVRMILLGYLYNVDSDRQLCEEVGYNLAYRWFCRLSLKDRVPDHSSLTKIRDRLGETIYREIFLTVVEQCRVAGLVKAERVMTDGSMFKANASLYKMVEREKKDDGYKDDPPGGGSAGVGIEGSKDGLSNRDLRKNSLVGKKLTNATHVSATDPDATLSGKHGEYKALNYKTHHMIDADSRVVIDCHLTTGAVSEVKVVVDRLEAVKAELGIEPKELIADRGYGSGENLIALKERGIKTNIPLWSTRVGYMFRKENPNFSFSSAKLEMICPEGHKMHEVSECETMHSFTISAHVCKKCPLYESCVTAPQKRQHRGKIIRIHKNQAIYNEVLEKEKDPSFIQKLRERMWKMEGIFAEAKSHHGLRRARYRGRWKVQIQVYMISTVQNLKRLAAAFIFVFRYGPADLRKIAFWPEIPRKNLFPT